MSNHGITVDYINPFIEATIHTFQTKCSLAPTRERLFLKGDGEEVYGVSEIVGLGSETTGVVVLNLPEVAAIRVGGKLAGQDFTALTAGVVDGVGELTRFIAEDAKNRLVQKGYKSEIGLTKVVTGRNYITTQSKVTTCVVVSFASEVGRFCLEVSLQKVA